MNPLLLGIIENIINFFFFFFHFTQNNLGLVFRDFYSKKPSIFKRNDKNHESQKGMARISKMLENMK